jgi:8-oxo-dGTP diphosphatase
MQLYGNRLRLRVCGICVQDNKILMLSHRGISQSNVFWCPPGGGAQFGETAHEALIREYKEETGLDIKICNLLFVNEFRESSLHAIELFFSVEITGGHQKLGSDPEMSAEKQIIQDLQWMTFSEIKNRSESEVHSLFKHCQQLEDIFRLNGYYS